MRTLTLTVPTFDFVADHLHWDGAQRYQLTSTEVWEVFCLGDGFGERTSEELKAINSGFDWSHVRDSSDAAIDRMATRILQLLTAKRERSQARSRLTQQLQAAQTAFSDNPSAANFTATIFAMVAYQNFIKNQELTTGA